MDNKNLKVLVISSVSPFKGPGVVALSRYNACINEGHEVDFLTKYKVLERPEFLSVYGDNPFSPKTPYVINIFSRIKNKLLMYTKYRHIRNAKEYAFFYEREDCPPVPPNEVLKKITKQYDMIHIVFWQGLLSFQTISAIHAQQKHCLFIFHCVDYSPMAGGCHFIGDCQRYQVGCGKCPAIGSNEENDFTAFNVQYRKRVYEEVKPIVAANGYMQTFFDKSYLLKDYKRRLRAYFMLDTENFKPLDRSIIKIRYKIPNNKKFIMLWGCQSLNDPRKGSQYLLESLRLFYSRLTNAERTAILVITIGNQIDYVKDKLLFDSIHLGYVPQNKLPEIYNLADVFLSPSVNDAGPSMVNQSIGCGTPVVAFEMGTALDVVKDCGTGYCAELRDSKDFANGIEYIFHLPNEQYEYMRHRCRQVTLEQMTETASRKRINEIWEQYKPE